MVKEYIKEFSITRVFNAPRELVWKAFTKRERLAQWWGPKGYKMMFSNLNLQPGGLFHYGLESPDGKKIWGKFVYYEIINPEKIIFIDSFSNEHGGITRNPMASTWPLEVWNTLTLTEHNGKTILKLISRPINATNQEIKTFEEGFASLHQGFKGTFDQLDEYLAHDKKKSPVEKTKEHEVIIIRILNAPRALVWKALTDQKHVAHWWGPKGFTNPVCEWNAKPGSSLLIHMQGPDGVVHPMDGMFHVVNKPERLIFTSAALNKNGERLFEVNNNITLAEQSEKTRLTMHATVTKTTPAAAPHLAGMSEGWNQSIDKLEDYLAEIQQEEKLADQFTM